MSRRIDPTDGFCGAEPGSWPKRVCRCCGQVRRIPSDQNLCEECYWLGVEGALANCKRCGELFKPTPILNGRLMSQHCEVCKARNLVDALGLPTPPELLDAKSKQPTLTPAEYSREVDRLIKQVQAGGPVLDEVKA